MLGEQKGADGDHRGSRTSGHCRGGGGPCPQYPPCGGADAGVDDRAVGGVHQAQQRDLGCEGPGCDLPAYRQLYDERLATLPGVLRLSSTLVMKSVVDARPLPL